MTEGVKPSGFGRYLRAVRREKGLSIERISRETRISAETLHLIEQEDLSGLPSEVFVKGFLRAYAKAVGADGDQAVAGYLQSAARLQKTEQSEADLNRLSTRFWPRLLLSLGLLLGVIVASVFLLSVFDSRQAPDPVSTAAVSENRRQAEAAPAAPAPEVAEVSPVFEAPAAPAPDAAAGAMEPEPGAPSAAVAGAAPPVAKQILQITAVEETWMKIVIDGERTKEVTLKPGDRIALEAASGYELLIGNAAGIRMTLNGKPVGLEGKSGQVRALKLPQQR